MDVNEIITKSNLELDEVKYVISQYIRDKKGVEINIVLDAERGVVNQIEFLLLFKAFDVAAMYYGEKQRNVS